MFEDGVRMLQDDNGAHPEPPLNPEWSDLRKAAWKAALVSGETRLSITVSDARDDILPTQFHGIRVEVNGSESGPYRYEDCWTYLNGIQAGAEALIRAAASTPSAQGGGPDAT